MRHKKTKKYGKGGDVGAGVGTGIGAAAGTWLLPGVGTKAGAIIGGALGRGVGSLFGKSKKEPEPEPPATVGRVFTSSYGFKKGGKLKKYQEGGTPKPPERGDRIEGYASTDRFAGFPPMFGGRSGEWVTLSEEELPEEEQAMGLRPDIPAEQVGFTGGPEFGGVGYDKHWGAPLSVHREGGSLDHTIVGGRHHEAGGVNLEELGRPDIEVERDEALTFDAFGEPDYVFSNLRMKDKPRTYAEEYKRLADKGDLSGIRHLKKKQEEAMGRKVNVTMDSSLRRAEMAKTGGTLREGGAVGEGFSPEKSAARYASKFGRIAPMRMQTGGATNARTFYSGPAGTGVGAPSGVSPVTGPPGIRPGPLGRAMSHLRYMGPLRATGLAGAGAAAGYYGATAIMGDNPFDAYGRMRDSQDALGRAQFNRGQQDFRRSLEGPGGTLEGSPYYVPPGTQPPVVATNPAPAASPAVSAAPAPMSTPEFREPGALRTELPRPGSAAMTPGGGMAPATVDVAGTPAAEVAMRGIDTPGEGRNWANTAASVLPYAVDAFNLISAARMKPPERPRTPTPVMMDNRVPTTAAEEAATRGARTVITDPSATAATRLAATAGLHQERGRIREQATHQSQAIDRHNVQALNRALELGHATDERHQDRLAQFEGARQTAISGTLRSASDRIERRAFEKRMAELEPMQLAALVHSMPTENRRQYINDLLNALPPGHRLRPQLEALSGRGTAA